MSAPTPEPTAPASADSGLHRLPALLAPLGPEARRAVLRADQRLRWQRGQPLPIGEYLRAVPGLADDPAAVLDLIDGESLLRQERGETPSADDYRERFPTLARAIGETMQAEEQLGALLAGSDASPSCTSPLSEATAAPFPGAPDGAPPLIRAAALPNVPGYEVLGVLGKGGMGVVYQARQRRLGRLVALKMILRAEHADDDDRRRFRLEAEAVARLQHAHIVQIFEVGEYQGKPFFSLEFCPSGSLDKKLAGTPLPPKEAAALVQSLAKAMHAAHQAGVVHRDLKPANVLLGADGAPKVTDFGLAKLADPAAVSAVVLTRSGEIVGTPSYMAPEQAAGKAVSTQTDVYALGAILYECLTGRPPFKAATVMDTLYQVLSGEPAPPSRLNPQTPRDLETICLKCLRKEPAQRYASAEALAHDLQQFQRGEPITARRVGVLGWASQWVRRYPAVAGLLGVVVLLAAVGAILITWVTARLIEASEWATHSNKVLSDVDAFLSLVKDSEASQRRFLLTDVEGDLKPYWDAEKLWPAALRDLERLVEDNKEQQGRLSRLEPLLVSKFEEMTKVIQLRKAREKTRKGDDAALELVRSGKGDNLMTEIQGIVETVRKPERDRLTELYDQVWGSVRVARFTVGTTVVISLLTLIGFLITRSRRKTTA
jgi:serine/threonine protein kinase